MEPIVVAVSLLAALAALSGSVHSYREMKSARLAERQFRQILLKNDKLRQELLAELSKRDVGERTLEALETRVSYLLTELPKDQRTPVRAALKQTSRQGQKDYLLKLAADETAH